MDPITPGIISGLAVSAVSSIAGRVLRAGHRDQTHGDEPEITSRVSVEINSIAIPVMNELADKAPAGHITAISTFLRSPEFSNYLHGVAIAVASAEEDNAKADLVDELTALLVLCGRVDPAASRRYASGLFGVFVTACRRVIAHATSSNRLGIAHVRDRALAEKNAGYLKSLQARTRRLRQWTTEDLAAIYEFAETYRQVIHAQTSDLIPAYFEHQRRVPIEHMYIEPSLEHDSEPETGRAGHIGLEPLVNTCFRTVILGDPGAGKSTLARKVVHNLSAHSFGAHNAEVVPFLVPLRRYEEAKRRVQSSLVEYLGGAVREEYQIPPPRGAIEYLILTGRAFVVLDGLDELLETHRRWEIVRAVEAFATLYMTTPILATSRRVGYWEAPLRPAIFETLHLREFSDREVADYAHKWFRLDDTLTPLEQERLAGSFLQESESIPDLRANPLMLSLLCNIYRGVHSIPRSRADLYDQCARLLFERWDASRGLVVQGPLKGDARAALQNVALWTFRDTALSSRIPESMLKKQLVNFLRKTRYESRERAEDAARQLLSLWRGRAWILTDVGTDGVGERVYKFTHQTFLEYFAAVELVRNNPTPPRLWRILEPHLLRGEWDIVAQIAIQLLDQGYDGAKDMMLKELVTAAHREQGRERHSCVAFAARHLDELMPRPATCRLITRAAIDLLVDRQPSLTSMPDLRDYYDASWLLAPGNDDEDIDDPEVDDYPPMSPEGALMPLLHLFSLGDELVGYVRDEFFKYCIALARAPDAEVGAKAFVLGMSYQSICDLAGDLRGDNAIETTHPENAVEQALISGRIPSETLEGWGEVNFWVRVVAARRGLAPLAWVAELPTLNALVTVSQPLLHRGGIWRDDTREPFINTVLSRLVFGRRGRDRLTDDDVSAVLTNVAHVARSADFTGVDRSWMAKSDLESKIVRRFFRHESCADEVIRLERQVRDHERRRRTGGRSSARMALDRDALFGAFVLLATVIEFEEWQLVDDSDDQAALLLLGPLQDLESAFVGRRIPGGQYEAEAAVIQSGLLASDAEFAIRWVGRRIDLVH